MLEKIATGIKQLTGMRKKTYRDQELIKMASKQDQGKPATGKRPHCGAVGMRDIVDIG